MHYAQKQGVVFEISMGLIDRGADVSWLSQYPHERELLFSPLTGCEITELSVEGSFLVAKVRLSVNLTTPTIEQASAPKAGCLALHASIMNSPKSGRCSYHGMKKHVRVVRNMSTSYRHPFSTALFAR